MTGPGLSAVESARYRGLLYHHRRIRRLSAIEEWSEVFIWSVWRRVCQDMGKEHIQAQWMYHLRALVSHRYLVLSPVSLLDIINRFSQGKAHQIGKCCIFPVQRHGGNS